MKRRGRHSQGMVRHLQLGKGTFKDWVGTYTEEQGIKLQRESSNVITTNSLSVNGHGNARRLNHLTNVALRIFVREGR